MWVAAVAAVAGAALSAYSSIQQGEAASKAEQYNAQVAANNAQQAKDAAAVNEESSAYRAKLLLASQKAAAGASGIDPNQGSPLSLMTDAAQQTTLDALKIRYGGETQSTAYVNQGQLDRFNAGQYARSGYLRGASTILGSGAMVYGALYGGPGAAPATNNSPELMAG